KVSRINDLYAEIRIPQVIAHDQSINSVWQDIQRQIASFNQGVSQGEYPSFDAISEISASLTSFMDLLGSLSGFDAGAEKALLLNGLLTELLPYLSDEIGRAAGLSIFHNIMDAKTAADISEISSYLSRAKFRLARLNQQIQAAKAATSEEFQR